MSVKLAIQTILNFFALDLIFNPIVGSILPVSGLGALLSFVYWGLLLISSYQLAVFLKKEKYT
ncbi:hypothetical protein [Carnobacterium jeotgali]|uniref:hypothetical protein n=1 Tax=Carnobacterium jeotgali TaxID=545534 RepID=UPI0004932F60|nr:hypothetical protein [Carnobacterium jeotgali]